MQINDKCLEKTLKLHVTVLPRYFEVYLATSNTTDKQEALRISYTKN